jgi:hypothetical protein
MLLIPIAFSSLTSRMKGKQLSSYSNGTPQNFAGGRGAPNARRRALASQRTASRSRGIRHRCLALEGGHVDFLWANSVTTNLRCHGPK